MWLLIFLTFISFWPITFFGRRPIYLKRTSFGFIWSWKLLVLFSPLYWNVVVLNWSTFIMTVMISDSTWTQTQEWPISMFVGNTVQLAELDIDKSCIISVFVKRKCHSLYALSRKVIPISITKEIKTGGPSYLQ